MARIRKLVMAALIILLLLVALVFSLNNRTAVSIDFLIYQTPELGLAVWLIGALVLGALLGMTVGSLASFRSGRSRRHLEKKLEHSEKALERQRSENAKGI
jgi:putative membrane protein